MSGLWFPSKVAVENWKGGVYIMLIVIILAVLDLLNVVEIFPWF